MLGSRSRSIAGRALCFALVGTAALLACRAGAAEQATAPAEAKAVPSPAAGKDAPSRAPVKGCKWEKASDAKLGLEAWVQRCDFGSRKIDFSFVGSALAVHYSDGGAPDPLIEVYPLAAEEAPESGVKRVFVEHTDK